MKHSEENNVVDFARFRANRDAVDLPLFARPLPSRPATVTAFRRLSDRDVAHRARMLAHLYAIKP
jgi:hypothetical protein